MLYPKNIEYKLGFDQIREFLKLNCLSQLGKDYVEKMRMSVDYELILKLISQTNDFKKILDQGWTDAIRFLYPDEVIYTFWDYFRNAYGRNAGLRIDHFLLSQDLVSRLKKGGVDKRVRGWEKTSDHAPVWIELSDV